MRVAWSGRSSNTFPTDSAACACAQRNSTTEESAYGRPFAEVIIAVRREKISAGMALTLERMRIVLAG